MDSQKFKALLISDFNIDIFKGYLNNDKDCPRINATGAPFGQVIPVLIEKNLECWRSNYDFVIVWTQPEAVIESFKCALNYQHVSIDKILKEVDEYSQVLMRTQGKVRFIFVPAWVYPTYHRGYGILELKDGIGVQNILMRMNLRLSENLSKASNVYLLNTQKWIEALGKNAFIPELWYMAKVPFGNEIFKEATKDIKAALKAITGNTKKLIILDLDNTLWGGIVGDLGWKNVKLGGHDHIGEAYVEFQAALKALNNRGILLGIVSKNEESVALETITKHPEMILSLKDFAGWKINWKDKAQNIVDLVADLSLGLQSVVFIDDDPAEQARVREALPEVFVPEWPENKMLYKKTLLQFRCFDTVSISKEDLARNKMYLAEKERQKSKDKFISLDQWLRKLNIRVLIEKQDESNLDRTVQLLNKTNQMNLSTRRLTASELIKWAKQKDHKLWVFSVSDKFGDYGLTGIISLEIEGKIGRIIDFVLSCRVIGRKIEETMLWTAIHYAQSVKLDKVCAEYIPTPKNKPCLEFWKRSGFIYDKQDNCYTWKTINKYTLPDCIQIGERKRL